jgi:hypothetical protein
MGWLFGMACALGGGLLVLLVLGALLRLAVSLTNRSLAPARLPAPPPRSGGIPEWDWDDWDDDGADGRLEPQRPWRAPRAIPEPGTLKGMSIMLLTSLGCGFTYVMMGFAAQELGFRMHRDATQFAVAVLNLPIGWLMLTTLLSIGLPTRFGRAALAAFVFALVMVGVAMFIGCVIGGLSVFLR